MNTNTLVVRSCLACTSFALFAGVLAGCGESGTAPADSGAASSPTPAEPDGRYATRGAIVSLPDPARPGSELQITHEAIAEFRDQAGNRVGMNTMTMGFPSVAPGVALDAFEVGDEVSLEFEVRWTGDPKSLVTQMAALPEGTVLDFSPLLRRQEEAETAVPGAEVPDVPAPGADGDG